MNREEANAMIRNLPLGDVHKLILMYMMESESDWTAREMLEHFREYVDENMEINTISGRMSELEKWGYLEVVGKRACAVSGIWVKARRVKLEKIRDFDTAEMTKESDKEVKRALDRAELLQKEKAKLDEEAKEEEKIEAYEIFFGKKKKAGDWFK